MATLPRMYNSKYKTNVTFPFSTSPRKLQEMSLPVQDTHDLTTASGVSLKQYEEKLNGLSKENFHLKLRVYFLEEKLGSGSPPAVQGLLEHNVRLQVEVEELRRQLTDKQELLAVAAEAIDVMEQQGFLSIDSVDGSMNVSSTVNKELPQPIQDNEKLGQTGEETSQETELIGDTIGIFTTNDEMGELRRLRKENSKALHTIKECFKKIQQQEKALKRLRKLNQESVSGSDIPVEKYEEILKKKNEYIKDLELKLMELQSNGDKGNEDTTGNLQELLTRRLQGLAYFLDKLLSHKCVLGEDKKKLAESILEQSLALPVGLKLDESMAPEDFTMDDSNLDISHSLKIEDLTMMFGHHVSCGEGGKVSLKKPAKFYLHPQPDNIMSESECWSEPDRKVSLARIGLCEVSPGHKESTSESNRQRSRRSRVSHGSRTEEKPLTESLFMEEIRQLNDRIESLEDAERVLAAELSSAKDEIVRLTTERNDLATCLEIERGNVRELTRASEASAQKLLLAETQAKDAERQLIGAAEKADRLRLDKQELEASFLETERCLRRAADEATVAASQAALERARAQHERLRLERELDEARLQLAARPPPLPSPPRSEDGRPTSPDQGIDSDRLSSLEHNDGISMSPRSLYEENLSLKQKLARTKATLADTLTQLNAANMRKRSVQRAICREIHKTHGVLRKARDQLENQNES